MDNKIDKFLSVFNSPVETGLRIICLLYCAYPQKFDLQRIIALDYIVVHTGDIGGPPSLHPSLPLRSGEILMRREIIERGIQLMLSRNLIKTIYNDKGIFYQADDFSEKFLKVMSASYTLDMLNRANWVIENFSLLDNFKLRAVMNQTFGLWTEEFHTLKTVIRSQS